VTLSPLTGLKTTSKKDVGEPSFERLGYCRPPDRGSKPKALKEALERAFNPPSADIALSHRKNAEVRPHSRPAPIVMGEEESHYFGGAGMVAHGSAE